jgi:multidrug efflux pump subunit AcrA (membrane-fusion protein)
MLMRLARWHQAHPVRVWVALAALAVGVAGLALWGRSTFDDRALSAVVVRGTLSARLVAGGVLRPVESISYRSPLGGRDTEVTFLVAEGTRVGEGDLIARLDTTELQLEVERATQELRQAQVDLQVAEIDRQQARAAMESLSEGEGALVLDEARTRLQGAKAKVDRLRVEADALKPLLDRGFITREELRKTVGELEQAEEDLALARRRADVLIGQTHPQDRQRAELTVAQKAAQYENVVARAREVETRLRRLQQQMEESSIYARLPGLVVYEEFLSASPRRKIRVGDRVTSSQGIVTIPDVSRMTVEASVSEADVHRLRPGQSAIVRIEAFPDLRLTGRVSRIGTLARTSADRPFEDKRFDLVVDLDPSDAELRPEMTARADILVGERKNVLVVPANAVFDRDGQMVCHVVRAFGIETRPVQLGEASETAIEVVAGLEEGMRVALSDVAAAEEPAAAGGTALAPGGTAPTGLLRDALGAGRNP